MTARTIDAPRVRPCTWTWLFLLVLTGVTFGVAEMGMGGLAVVALVLATTLVKGQLVVSHFMGLRHVRLFWRLVMFGWLAGIGALIGLAYWIGLG